MGSGTIKTTTRGKIGLLQGWGKQKEKTIDGILWAAPQRCSFLTVFLVLTFFSEKCIYTVC